MYPLIRSPTPSTSAPQCSISKPPPNLEKIWLETSNIELVLKRNIRKVAHEVHPVSTVRLFAIQPGLVRTRINQSTSRNRAAPSAHAAAPLTAPRASRQVARILAVPRKSWRGSTRVALPCAPRRKGRQWRAGWRYGGHFRSLAVGYKIIE